MKVVNMLKDMEAELVSDLEDDKKVHEMLDCWCKTNEKEKTAAIEAGEATEAELEASLQEVAAKMAEIKTKREGSGDARIKLAASDESCQHAEGHGGRVSQRSRGRQKSA